MVREDFNGDLDGSARGKRAIEDKNNISTEIGILLNESSGLYTGDGSVDIKGQPVLKSNTGNWRACPFILGTECCERLAFFGIATNLVSYLTKTMHEGNVSAARNVSNWTGTAYLTPLIGAVLADVCWGRYWTIAVFSAIYFLSFLLKLMSSRMNQIVNRTILETSVLKSAPKRAPKLKARQGAALCLMHSEARRGDIEEAQLRR
ncbi:hypothetical protein TEA_021624 [Camellia sinensis var. sinensis]|uniref:Uncharacterized protein n=1 Tax=Camellia sinensis var. sinensis TaxID=542762 RepID=A0A4S4ENP7_CAMSN|nr:hypothetical protein TEA_021624 [Camellia sinensis var. sinensis]